MAVNAPWLLNPNYLLTTVEGRFLILIGLPISSNITAPVINVTDEVYFRRYLDDPNPLLPDLVSSSHDPGSENDDTEYYRRYLGDPII